MTLPNRSNQHDAYLVRVWRADADAEWRVFVENVHTGETKGFSDIDALMVFLQQKPRVMDAADSNVQGTDREQELGN